MKKPIEKNVSTDYGKMNRRENWYGDGGVGVVCGEKVKKSHDRIAVR